MTTASGSSSSMKNQKPLGASSSAVQPQRVFSGFIATAVTVVVISGSFRCRSSRFETCHDFGTCRIGQGCRRPEFQRAQQFGLWIQDLIALHIFWQQVEDSLVSNRIAMCQDFILV